MNDVCAQSCFHPAAIAAAQAQVDADEARVPGMADAFKALGHPARLTIVRALRTQELCVCDLAGLLGLSVGATSQQLRLLRQQGWLALRNEGRMAYYRLRADAPLDRLQAELASLSAALATPAEAVTVDA